MSSSLEKSIIAYFDNRLSDAERSELLERVNTSPDARSLFRQHEILNSLVHRAQTSTVVDADLETALFDRIAQMDTPVVPRFSQVSAALFAIAAAIVLLLSYGIYHLELNRDIPKAGTHSSSLQSHPVQIPQVTSGAHSLPRPALASLSGVRDVDQLDGVDVVDRAVSQEQPVKQDLPITQDSPSEKTEDNSTLPVISSVAIATFDSPPSSTSFQYYSGIALSGESQSYTPLPLAFSLEFTSGAANERRFSVATGFRAAAYYNVFGSNYFGLRLSSTHYQLSPLNGAAKTELQSPGKHEGYAIDQVMAEAVVGHEEILFHTPLRVSVAISGGLMSQGSVISLEGGLSMPVTSHLSGGLGFSLYRVHSNAAGIDIPRASAGSLWEISGSSKSVNGRLSYGLTYRF